MGEAVEVAAVGQGVLTSCDLNIEIADTVVVVVAAVVAFEHQIEVIVAAVVNDVDLDMIVVVVDSDAFGLNTVMVEFHELWEFGSVYVLLETGHHLASCSCSHVDSDYDFVAPSLELPLTPF